MLIKNITKKKDDKIIVVFQKMLCILKSLKKVNVYVFIIILKFFWLTERDIE